MLIWGPGGTQTMPAGAIRFEARAGAGLLMDLRTWHSALGPTVAAAEEAEAGGQLDRCGLIIQTAPFGYKQEVRVISSSTNSCLQCTPATELEQPAARQGFLSEEAGRLEASGALAAASPLVRQLLGLQVTAARIATHPAATPALRLDHGRRRYGMSASTLLIHLSNPRFFF